LYKNNIPTNFNYSASDGSSTAGSVYSFGTGTATERALGSIASGTPGTIYYGACFTNNTANAIEAVTIGYIGEQWRLGQATQTADLLTFQYSLTETTINGTDFDNFSALNFSSPITTGTAGVALNGNLPANRVNFTNAKLEGLNLAPGATLFIRWVDVDTAGSDNGLSIDDFTITAVNSPTVTDIPDQVIPTPGNSTAAISFTTGDVETNPVTNVTVSSDNQTVVPNGNLTLVNTGANMWTIQALGAATGTATITVTVTDGNGNVTTTTFSVLVGSVPQCAAGGEIQVTPGTPATDPVSGITLYASTLATTPAAANALDDDWVTAAGMSTADASAGGLNGSNNSAMQFVTVGTGFFAVSTREMGSLGDINSAPCQGKNISIGRTIFSNNIALQEGAPRPTVIASTVFSYSENLGGFSPTSGARNALLFDFDISRNGFGAWFGDVESRALVPADTRAVVRFFDAGGNRLGNDFVINETDTSYGNKATRWIGFLKTTATVKSMLVIVGDNDSFTPLAPLFDSDGKFSPQVNGIGTNEHLSFIGAKFGLGPTAANGSVSGRVMTENGRGISRARVSVLNANTQETRTYQTNSFGYFRFDDLPFGDFYIVTVNHKRYVFANGTQSFQLLENVTDLTFLGN
jgi:hypothetical protein